MQFGISVFQSVKINNENKIVPVVLYVSEIWSLTLSKGHRLKLLQNRVVRKLLDLSRIKRQETEENDIMSSYIICTLHQILERLSISGK
jgi:hypothetical protein